MITWSLAAHSVSLYGPAPAVRALQPGIAEIAVGLVRHHRLHIHHAADIGTEAVQHEAGRLRLFGSFISSV